MLNLVSHSAKLRDALQDQPGTGCHPLHATGIDHAFMATGIVVRQHAVEDEGDGFKTAMRMRAEWQAIIARAIDLRAVMIKEQKWTDTVEAWAGHGPARGEVADIVAISGMKLLDSTHGICLATVEKPQYA